MRTNLREHRRRGNGKVIFCTTGRKPLQLRQGRTQVNHLLLKDKSKSEWAINIARNNENKEEQQHALISIEE